MTFSAHYIYSAAFRQIVDQYRSMQVLLVNRPPGGPERITLRDSNLLGVPSAVVNISYNVLLHPRHALYPAIEVIGQQDLILDQRLWNSPRQ